MNYEETVAYLFSQLPMFQRVGAAAYKADLSNTIALCKSLDNPHQKFKSIHVAGTNGKGSVSSALASIFHTCGYKTGLFTSPHLLDYRERIKIDGQMIEESFVVDFVERIKRDMAELKPSFFEISCAMAFAYFAQNKVDIAILEVGMGGRLDSTNVVEPECAIITSISKDHEKFLGDTIEKIAREKGGIIKANTPVVVGENDLKVVEELRVMALEKDAPFYDIYTKSPFLQTDLTGSYQRENMRTVNKVVDVMRQKGWKLDNHCVEKGAINVRKNTGLRGRWETIGERPRIITDVGHNEAGVQQVVDHLRKESYVRLHIVWGMVDDKDAKNILMLLPTSATYYWCKPNVPRGKDSRELSNEALKFSLEGRVYESVKSALSAAKEEAMLNDLIFVGGSTFVVAEVLDYVR
ncbi:MAG: folylpolyglutamate synthase/dihydrofolate synthase family protein [Cryomorphaceae bacterium]|nr:bifunctional folylpolyglutamate synthase/dihydrofolate synthase [Flavobacteriales bacterium]